MSFDRFGFAARAALAVVLMTAPAAAQPAPVNLKFASFAPEGAASSRQFKRYQEELQAKTGGRATLEIFYGGSMGPMPRHYDLVRTGVADMAFFQQGQTPGRFPLTELSHLPYLFPSGPKGVEVSAKVMADLKDRYLAAEHSDTRLLWIGFNQASSVWTANRPVRKLEDLQGLRLTASTPTLVALFRAQGVAPVGIPIALVAEALQKGTVDGASTDAFGVFSFKLGNLVRYNTPVFTANVSFGIAVNPAAYARLPADGRAVVDSWSMKERAVADTMYIWGDFPPVAKYVADSKVEHIELGADDDRKVRAASDRFIDRYLSELNAKGLPAREVYGQMKSLSARYAAGG
jgi:TRAP-type C4-dicarboxylate transport system substrate-binding protein